jgi:hypothetical protein
MSEAAKMPTDDLQFDAQLEVLRIKSQVDFVIAA